ncbi:protein of unknown function [Azospirillum baldaniorum]|uniref:Uncharacterized protein n=1 Tax=Azospirillum baldaniorum TaxID=1064539 RepID=A0A9P1JSM9_9PROT|nr:protein of unknown function [Azospirillum baldaniorum]
MRGLRVAIRPAKAQPPHPPRACGAGPLPLPGGARGFQKRKPPTHARESLVCAGGGA